MKVNVNGHARELPEPCTIEHLLETLDLGKAACAVEVNQELVTKGRHAACQLREGDDVEIVTLVGGG